MANQSIYSDRWIDLVFENRNKAYGAYQLRQENPKTTLKALGIGLLLLTFLVSIPMFTYKFRTQPEEIRCFLALTPIELSSVVFPPEKKPDLQAATPFTQKKNDKPKREVDQSNLIDPTVIEAKKAKTEIAINEQIQENFTDTIEGALIGTENSGIIGGTGTEIKVNPDEENGAEPATRIAAVLDKQPSFPGGMNKFYNYVAQNFKTPETELGNTIKIFVSFVIEKDGTMTDIQVVRNPGFGLDQEAIRVLKSLKTKWTPGILNGKPVRTSYNLPITIKQR